MRIKLQVTLKGIEAEKFMRWYEESKHGKPGYGAKELINYGIRVKEAVDNR